MSLLESIAVTPATSRFPGFRGRASQAECVTFDSITLLDEAHRILLFSFGGGWRRAEAAPKSRGEVPLTGRNPRDASLALYERVKFSAGFRQWESIIDKHIELNSTRSRARRRGKGKTASGTGEHRHGGPEHLQPKINAPSSSHESQEVTIGAPNDKSSL